MANQDERLLPEVRRHRRRIRPAVVGAATLASFGGLALLLTRGTPQVVPPPPPPSIQVSVAAPPVPPAPIVVQQQVVQPEEEEEEIEEEEEVLPALEPPPPPGCAERPGLIGYPLEDDDTGTAMHDFQIEAVATSGCVIAVGGEDVVLVSRNDGESFATALAWEQAESELESVAVDRRGNVYALRSHGGLVYLGLQRPDGRETWRSLPYSNDWTFSVEEGWLVLTRSNVIGLSSDQGKTWRYLRVPTVMTSAGSAVTRIEPDGTLWLLRSDDEHLELWRGRADGERMTLRWTRDAVSDDGVLAGGGHVVALDENVLYDIRPGVPVRRSADPVPIAVVANHRQIASLSEDEYRVGGRLRQGPTTAPANAVLDDHGYLITAEWRGLVRWGDDGPRLLVSIEAPGEE